MRRLGLKGPGPYPLNQPGFTGPVEGIVVFAALAVMLIYLGSSR